MCQKAEADSSHARGGKGGTNMFGDLVCYRTGRRIRPATEFERNHSREVREACGSKKGTFSLRDDSPELNGLIVWVDES